MRVKELGSVWVRVLMGEAGVRRRLGEMTGRSDFGTLAVTEYARYRVQDTQAGYLLNSPGEKEGSLGK